MCHPVLEIQKIDKPDLLNSYYRFSYIHLQCSSTGAGTSVRRSTSLHRLACLQGDRVPRIRYLWQFKDQFISWNNTSTLTVPSWHASTGAIARPTQEPSRVGRHNRAVIRSGAMYRWNVGHLGLGLGLGHSNKPQSLRYHDNACRCVSRRQTCPHRTHTWKPITVLMNFQGLKEYFLSSIRKNPYLETLRKVLKYCDTFN